MVNNFCSSFNDNTNQFLSKPKLGSVDLISNHHTQLDQKIDKKFPEFVRENEIKRATFIVCFTEIHDFILISIAKCDQNHDYRKKSNFLIKIIVKLLISSSERSQ